MSLTIIGSSNLDYVYSIEKPPVTGETIFSNGPVSKFYGGKGANCAMSCSICSDLFFNEFHGNFLTSLGDDEIGREMEKYFKKTFKSISPKIQFIEGETTGHAIILKEKSDNSIIVHSGANLEKEHFGLNSPINFLVIGNETSQSLNLFGIDNLVEHGILVYNPAPFNFKRAHEIFKRSKNHKTYCILNSEEFDQFLSSLKDEDDDSSIIIEKLSTSQNKKISSFLNNFPNMTIIVTNGGGPTWVVSNSIGYTSISNEDNKEIFNEKNNKEIFHGKKSNLETLPVLDTTGAGDAFVGAFSAYLFSHGDGDENILRGVKFARFWASMTVRFNGAQESYLKVEEYCRSIGKEWN